MKELTIRYPDELPGLLRKTDREFADEARFLLAAKLYELGKVSGGKAAEMAGCSRLEFLRHLAEYGIAAINLDEDREDAERFLAKHPVGFAQAADASGSCPRRFGVAGMPATYLVDREGVIRHEVYGHRSQRREQLRLQVQELVAPGAGALVGPPPGDTAR